MNLVLHHGALGDFALIFGLIRSLAPEPTAVVASSSKARLAAELFDHVEAFGIESPPWSSLHVPDARQVHDSIRSARRIFSFVSSGGDSWAANARRINPDAAIYFIEPRPNGHWTGHVCDWHRQQLVEQGWHRPAAAAPARANLDGPVVIHPGSAGRRVDKNWPAARFEAAINRLRGMGRLVQPVLGEVEMNNWDPDRLTYWRDRLGAHCLTDLDKLRASLQSARAFIGNDSGPTHLAAQLGVPTLALFGPTDAAVWSPRGSDVTVMCPPSPTAMDWLSVDAVMLQAARF
jgi:hypothetical protein